MGILDTVIGGNNLLDLHRTYNWDIFMPFSAGGVPGVVLSKFCQDIKFGEYGITDLSTLKHGAFQLFYPGFLQINPVTMTFLKPFPDIVSMFFHGWKEQMISRVGYYSPKVAYKHNVYVFVNSSQGIPADRFILEGCFPKTFPSYELSYDSEDIIKFNIEFSVDRVVKMGWVDTATRVKSFAKSLSGIGKGGLGSTLGSV